MVYNRNDFEKINISKHDFLYTITIKLLVIIVLLTSCATQLKI